MIDEKLLEILCCPKCKGDLEYQKEKERFVCHTCKLGYPIRDEIPVMLIEEAERLSD
ncbi:Trm112 family protein [candidate division TA06 bacterium]|nr:Trm112 family protein [candidate division TA06 bacterium]